MVYKVLHYTDHSDLMPQVIHNVQSDRDNNVFNSGKLKQVYNGVDTLDFTIDRANLKYGGIKPLKSIIEVRNYYTNEIIFRGRVLKPKTILSGGIYRQSYIAESLLSYLNDSVQKYAKIANTGELRSLFEYIINRHNERVEPHKRFKIGEVTMTSDSDVPYRYLDYGKTFEVIKDVLIGQIGGVIRLRYEKDGNYIDWLEEYGEIKKTKLKPIDNVLSAYRETSFEQIITRLMPVGATLENSNDTNSNATHERLTIASVNGGDDYLEDEELIKEFGIIENTMDWSDIDDPAILNARGKQFLSTQKSILTSWEAEFVELGWVDSRYEMVVVGNYHPIDAEYMSPEEVLKVVGKEVDLLHPEIVQLTIGETIQTLSSYQNALREATKSIQRVNQQASIYHRQLEELKAELANSTTDEQIAALERQIKEQQSGGTP